MSTATAAPTTVRSRGIPEQYKAILQQILVVAVLILLSVFFTIMKPAFADWSNLSSLQRDAVFSTLSARAAEPGNHVGESLGNGAVGHHRAHDSV